MSTASALIHTLQLQQSVTLDRIDQALDRGDRRAFRSWCKRHVSLTRRLEACLLDLIGEDQCL